VSKHRVLLVGDRRSLPKDLPDLLRRDSRAPILAEAATAIGSALAMLSKGGYDAALCWVERDDELAGVIRIRKARPELPILVLSTRDDPDFAALARQAGATRTARSSGELGTLSELLRVAITSGDLAREVRAQSRAALTQATEVRELAQKTRDRLERMLQPVERAPREFTPILVEDDPDQASFMVKAFGKIQLPHPLSVFKSGADFIAYLQESEREMSSGKRPCPSVIILDLEMPQMSGLEVLQWIRKHPRYARLPVVMLSHVMDPAKVNEAYQLGANSFLAKPSGFGALVEIAKGLRSFWGELNQGPW
jgi:DNA-binding NarL/FixJ family response regulator